MFVYIYIFTYICMYVGMYVFIYIIHNWGAPGEAHLMRRV